jgi:hypothetical protein
MRARVESITSKLQKQVPELALEIKSIWESMPSAKEAFASGRKAVSTGDPVQDLRNEAADLGYDGDPNDLQAMARFCWEEAPTDGMARLLEELAAAGVISSPF